MRKIILDNKGFTIVELLAVISILVVISGVIAGILYSTLRGSRKVKISTEITQNGTYVLGYMTRAIGDSRAITKVGTANVGFLENEGDMLDCTSSPSANLITFRKLDNSTTTFSCSGGDIRADGVSLINTDEVQSDDVSCSFSCTQNTDDLYAIPIIKVRFKLSDKNASLFEARASSNFETSVALKNNQP